MLGMENDFFPYSKDEITLNSLIDANAIRKVILDQSFRAHVGHIGSALSVADIIYALYFKILNIKTPNYPDRDRFILSKGHSALALYAALYYRGWISKDELDSYCTSGTYFGVHPENKVPGVDFCSGSLGQGITYATGAALAAKIQKSQRRIFTLISDGECNEGSVWEAVMVASQFQLSNLIVIIDLNNQQAFGYTKDVINLSPMGDRWKAFNWDVVDIDGHSPIEITKTIEKLNLVDGPPHVIVAHTTFGKGVSFMENKIKWHYFPMSEEEYSQALIEISQQ